MSDDETTYVDKEGEETVGDKLAELKHRSHNPFDEYEHVGYITQMRDQIDERGRIVFEVEYPSAKKSFMYSFQWPIEWSEEYELYRFINSDYIPWNAESLQKETVVTVDDPQPVPIKPDEREIIVPDEPESTADVLSSRFNSFCYHLAGSQIEFTKEHGLTSAFSVAFYYAICLALVVVFTYGLLFVVGAI